jgi:2-aminoethylphosphonate-pyruvate transaminase
MLLLSPGPVTLTERVRRSLLQPDLCHRESEFFDLQDEARQRLLDVYALDPAVWTAALVTASGTGAVESMIASLVPAEGRLLVVDNGIYGDRITQICAQYGIAHERVAGDWMHAPDWHAVAARLDRASFSHAALVHHETTTGRLNELSALAEICRTRGVGLLSDCVSSFGAEAIDFANAGLEAVAGTANKCLHGVPGVSFVIARRTALARATRRTYYLDLGRLSRLQDERGTPFTPAVHACYGLVEALREFADEGGRLARHRRYAALAERVRSGLAERGIEAAIPARESSVVLRAYRLPPLMTYTMLHAALKAEGFVIYAGQSHLTSTLFRISTMGDVSAGDIDRLLQCVARMVE